MGKGSMRLRRLHSDRKRSYTDSENIYKHSLHQGKGEGQLKEQLVPSDRTCTEKAMQHPVLRAGVLPGYGCVAMKCGSLALAPKCCVLVLCGP
eukprot:860577-Pelagomonas_calceolata.AAC.5